MAFFGKDRNYCRGYGIFAAVTLCFLNNAYGMNWSDLTQFTTDVWLLTAFAVLTFIQLGYWWYFFRRPACNNPSLKPGYKGGISVVICAKNEAQNLEKHLPDICSQDFPEFEVIVVDDGSDDDTSSVMQIMQSHYPHLKLISLRENVNFFKGKKLALSVGIKSARYPHVLLTDADCRPLSPHWITRMADHFDENTQLVLGYGKYRRLPGWLNALIRFDTLITATQYLSLALAGKPYMGVGRNLAYSKQLFYGAKGFTSHYRLLSGDDDLFVNQVAKKENTAVEINPQSHTESEPKTRLRDWVRQKRRHLSTGIYYKAAHKRILGVYSFSWLLFHPVFAAVIIVAGISPAGILAAGLWIIRQISVLIILHRICRRLSEAGLSAYTWLFDIIYPALIGIFAFTGVLYPAKKWK